MFLHAKYAKMQGNGAALFNRIMKKTALFAVCVLLLCGGLFCLHLTAQPERTSTSEKLTSLLDLKIEDTSERELLELKVASCQQLVKFVLAARDGGLREGSTTRSCEANAYLAATEMELYRHTGERDKFLAAMEAKVQAQYEKLRAVTAMIEMADRRARQPELSEAQIQLLDALLEQKRILASLNEK